MTLLVLLAVLVALAWAPGRPTPRVRDGPWAGRVRRLLRGRRRVRRLDLAVVVTEVASRLRTGATPEAAWATTVGRLLGPAAVVDGVGPGGAAGGEDGVPPALARLVTHCAGDPAAAAAVRTVVAASRLTHTLGSPLAEVLDRCAVTVTEAEQAHDARKVALAGPRSTARILAGLPLLGLLLGAGLGADPLGSATDGGWGTASVLTGLLLLLAGRRWTTALVTAAEAPGHAVRRRSRAAAQR
ncbi:tight adherence protein B [Georgenia satyanarayanai]|uniref:Tight adherence protein B n=1 Tax=Georgenia satyanarayanai TaxID=860221 RepID=A0A2Y9BWN4_9MICO|nr:hypothetical protein [Georgenia satyanarayanai]PYG01133.1 tight adherence protein B [Georgenia satyanarayanai]SSA39372.1 tight adherence protein B [Georgenia satyanarayanai]